MLESEYFSISLVVISRLVQGADISKAGVDFFLRASPSRLQCARVICYVREDTRFRERGKKRSGKRDEERERTSAISWPAGA